jgi:signal transduction histidine kinase
MSDSDDRRRVQRVAISIGLSVGVASALVIAAGVGVLIAAILLNRRPEGLEHGGAVPEHGPGDDFVIDADRILPLVVVLGVVGVVLLAAIAWFAARRSVRPLADALRLQRNFVADASHELRTPLTTLSSRIQVLQRRQQRGEEIDGTIAELRADAAMMTDVLNDLLLAAEAGEDPASGPTAVAPAVGAAVDALRPLADETGVAFDVAVESDLAVRLPSVTLVRLVVALLDNAVQHSPTGATVTVTAAREGSVAAIRVADAGPGIQGIEPDAVFERFARSAETGRRRGFGLGLSLVRDVADRAGGGVEVERTSPRGTTFLLRLPSGA